MSNEEKLNDKRFIVVRKSTINAGLILTVISIISACVTVIMSFTRLSDNTFDSQSQKQQVIDFVEKGHPASEVQMYQLKTHVNDENLHLSKEENDMLVRLENNQVKIGQDLQEIKHLLKQKNN